MFFSSAFAGAMLVMGIIRAFSAIVRSHTVLLIIGLKNAGIITANADTFVQLGKYIGKMGAGLIDAAQLLNYIKNKELSSHDLFDSKFNLIVEFLNKIKLVYE